MYSLGKIISNVIMVLQLIHVDIGRIFSYTCESGRE